MIVYRYKAYGKKGKIYTGNLFVPNEEEAIVLLLRNGLTPIEVKILPQSIIAKILFNLFFKISFQQKIYLMRSLYLILKSGISLNKGLEILTQESKGGLRDFLFYLNYNLQKGEPFYQTFANFPNVFSKVEIETIKAGEISGNLVNNLQKLSENLEKQREIKNEIISNLIYPIIVLLLSLGVIVLLITFVMPKIGTLLMQLNPNPPLLTKILIQLSNFINDNISLVSLVLFITFLFFVLIFLLRRTRNFIFKIFLSLPLIKKVYFNLSLGQAFFILRSLLNVGLTLTEALVITAEANLHPDIRSAFYNFEKGLREGKKLNDVLITEDKMPVFAANILGVAFETGYFEETLKVMEDFYLQEFRRGVNNLLNLLQPMLLIFVGIVVGFVAIAVLVPIYQQISQQLQIEGRGQIPGGLK